MSASIPVKIILAILVKEQIISQTAAQRRLNELQEAFRGIPLDGMTLRDFIDRLV